ncbi:MAG: ABC transporter permease [Clostridium butyricum]|nr:ABC transporter permease [Clostridium butyricum]
MNSITIFGSSRKKYLTRRKRTIICTIVILILLSAILISGSIINESMLGTNFVEKNMPPSLKHLFGTDWLGRDMFIRTIKGLSISLFTGILASAFSTVISLILGICAATLGKFADDCIQWLIDYFMGIPHLILLMLICILLGKGVKGVVIGVAITHWPSLCRVIRAEVMQLRQTQYVKLSYKFGKGKVWVAVNHLIPHLLPQFIVGLILLFPHAILHEASITFLGFGLSPHEPAVGIILSESMKYLTSGQWWLAFFPGLSLLIIVRLFDILGGNIRAILDGQSANE